MFSVVRWYNIGDRSTSISCLAVNTQTREINEYIYQWRHSFRRRFPVLWATNTTAALNGSSIERTTSIYDVVFHFNQRCHLFILSRGRWLLDDALAHHVIFEKKTTVQIIIERNESISGVDWHSSYLPPFVLKCGSLAAEWSFSRSFTANFFLLISFFLFSRLLG